MGRIEAAVARASDTREVLVGRGALGRVGELFDRLFSGAEAVVVADENTWAVAGDRLEASLAARRPVPQPFVFPAHPTLHADFEHALELEAFLRGRDAAPVALGSGTINDLTKLAADRLGRPYLSVATAASVDGYTAFGASITKDGFKQTMACAAPRGVVGDLDLLAGAPPALGAAGYGDLLAKVTAGADWLVADALGLEPIDPNGWELVQGGLRAALADPAGVASGDPAAVGAVFEGLLLAGLAMQATRSSRVASGAEHLLSHLWDMGGLGVRGDDVPHGFKTGAASVSIARIYGWLLGGGFDRLDVEAAVAGLAGPGTIDAQVAAAGLSGEAAARAVEEARAKWPTPELLRTRLARLRAAWPVLADRLRTQLLPADELAAMLRAAGAPAEPAAFGVSRAQLRASLAAARLIRRRYSVLDLLAEAALLEPCLDALWPDAGS